MSTHQPKPYSIIVTWTIAPGRPGFHRNTKINGDKLQISPELMKRATITHR